MSGMPLELVAVFRGAGWRYPLRIGDGVEVWQGQTYLGTIPTLLLLQVLGHYLQAATLQDAVRTNLTPTLPSPLLRHADKRRLRGRRQPSSVSR